MGDCNSCKSKNKMPETVPYIMHESAMARAERGAKRLWIVIILLIVMLVGTNVGWLIYESQFEDLVITQEVEQDADNGENHFIGGDYIGETDNQNND